MLRGDTRFLTSLFSNGSLSETPVSSLGHQASPDFKHILTRGFFTKMQICAKSWQNRNV